MKSKKLRKRWNCPKQINDQLGVTPLDQMTVVGRFFRSQIRARKSVLFPLLDVYLRNSE
jgi:hypothetical protein